MCTHYIRFKPPARPGAGESAVGPRRRPPRRPLPLPVCFTYRRFPNLLPAWTVLPAWKG
jgi:hypothetical protein